MNRNLVLRILVVVIAVTLFATVLENDAQACFGLLRGGNCCYTSYDCCCEVTCCEPVCCDPCDYGGRSWGRGGRLGGRLLGGRGGGCCW